MNFRTLYRIARYFAALAWILATDYRTRLADLLPKRLFWRYVFAGMVDIVHEDFNHTAKTRFENNLRVTQPHLYRFE